MVYITGDMHGDFRRLSKKQRRRSGYQFTENDYVIVLGDFGLCWAEDKTFEYNCKWFSQLPFTILFIDGNHENHDMLESYPVEMWHGGKVHQIVRDKVIHLMRGQIFNIDGFSFFTMGGGQSHDIEGGLLDRHAPDFRWRKAQARKNKLNYRIIGESWWSQELPSAEECAEGIVNLTEAGFKVDFILSHCTSVLQQKLLKKKLQMLREIEVNDLTNYFDQLNVEVEFRHWFSGHIHIDVNIDSYCTIVYEKIIPLDKYMEVITYENT